MPYLVNGSETALTQLADLLILIYDSLSIERLSIDVEVEIAAIEEVSAVSRLELKTIFSIELRTTAHFDSSLMLYLLEDTFTLLGQLGVSESNGIFLFTFLVFADSYLKDS